MHEVTEHNKKLGLHFELETDTKGCLSLKVTNTYINRKKIVVTQFSFTIGYIGIERLRKVVNSPRSGEYVEIKDTTGVKLLMISKVNPTYKPRLCMSFIDEESEPYQVVVTGDDFDRLSELLNTETDPSSK